MPDTLLRFVPVCGESDGGEATSREQCLVWPEQVITAHLGLFTCDLGMGADASSVFNYLTDYSAKQDYRKFLAAPVNMRSKLEALIQREIEHQQRGGQTT